MHPLRIGTLYGVIAAALQLVTAYLQSKVTNHNSIVGIVGYFVLPLVAVYLASHLSGRRERLKLGTTITSGPRATLHGTGAGLTAGLVFVILSSLSALLYVPLKIATSSGGVGGFFHVAGSLLGGIGGIIAWLVIGLLAGTLGGAFGDSLAHKQLKSGAVPPAAPVAKKG